MLWWLMGCTPGVDLDLWEGPNHLLPLYLEVDAERQRAFSFSRMHGTIAVIDTANGALLTVFPLDDFPPAPGGLVAVDEGVWVLWEDVALLYSPSGQVLRSLGGGVLDIRGDRIAVPEGVYEGEVLTPTDVPPLKLFGTDVVLLEDGRVYEGDTLVCQAPFGSRRAAWDGTSVFVVKGAQVGRCGGVTVTLNEPKVPMLVGEELWVLDRIGDEDPNVAQLRVLDPATLTVLRSGNTGKNSGYGGHDGTRLWVNSEGSSEVLGLLDEVVDVRIQTGVHVESVAGGVVTGRLSNRLWTESAERDMAWPVAPIEHEGAVWVLRQLDMTLEALDPETLETLETLDLGVGLNDTLTLSDTAVWNGQIWVTDGARDQLIGPDVIHPLGTPMDADASGRLELVVGDNALYVVRGRDGRVHRVDANGPSEPVRVDIEPKTRMQLGGFSEGLLWVGGVGLDGTTLEVVDTADWDFLVTERVVWQDGLRVDGDVVYTQGGEELPEVSVEGRKVFVTDIDGAAVRTFSL